MRKLTLRRHDMLNVTYRDAPEHSNKELTSEDMEKGTVFAWKNKGIGLKTDNGFVTLQYDSSGNPAFAVGCQTARGLKCILGKLVGIELEKIT